MADELVDIVNEKDEVIGQKMKSECHKRGLWHRISGVLLFNSQGKVWLQTRNKDKISGGLLDFSASGHVGAGDNYERGAYREMKEELGIKTELKIVSGTIHYEKIDIGEHKIRHALRVYTGKWDGPFSIQKEELEKVDAYELSYVIGLARNDSNLMTKALRLALEALDEGFH